MKLTRLELYDINDEQARTMQHGLNNVNKISVKRSHLTSVGFQAIANAIGNRENQVKIKHLIVFCLK